MNPDILQAFEDQAASCKALGSPFTSRICMAFAENLRPDSTLGKIINDWQGDPTSTGDALALRLCGALHALILDEADDVLKAAYPDSFHKWSDDALWSAIQHALNAHEPFFISRMKSAPQTNEIRRSGALVPGFLEIAHHFNWPLVLSEIGSSAGLNLNWDQYQYSFGDKNWGPEKSPIHLAPEWSGKPPHIDKLEILSREGCDLNPLDMTKEADQTRLLSYLWPDQIERIERTRQAISIAQGHVPKITKSGAADWLEQRLTTRYENAVHIVYHSIMWQYLSKDEQDRCRKALDTAGAKASKNSALAWLRLEADEDDDGAGLYLTLWPTGKTTLIGRADFHGRWVKWFGL
ncbi:MAG: DUF2332 family protein [Rhizobiaceae bacterium]|nr:DUF2332 family protein [Rhizobiaceae bacterium]